MRLLELRKQNNKSQQEIADLLNIRQNNYSKYELGKTEPNINSLIKLADYYNVSIDYLVGRDWHNDIGYLTPKQMECVKLIKQLDDNQISTAMGIMTTLLIMQN